LEVKMIKHEELATLVLNLCQMAIKGELKIGDLSRLWPKEANNVCFLLSIYEDVENGVEHIPGFLFKKGIDLVSWQQSDMYMALYLDIILLRKYGDKNDDELMEFRESVLKKEKLSVDLIESLGKSFFNS